MFIPCMCGNKDKSSTYGLTDNNIAHSTTNPLVSISIGVLGELITSTYELLQYMLLCIDNLIALKGK